MEKLQCRNGHTTLSYDGKEYLGVRYAGWVANRSDPIQVYLQSGRFFKTNLINPLQKLCIEVQIASILLKLQKKKRISVIFQDYSDENDMLEDFLGDEYWKLEKFTSSRAYTDDFIQAFLVLKQFKIPLKSNSLLQLQKDERLCKKITKTKGMLLRILSKRWLRSQLTRICQFAENKPLDEDSSNNTKLLEDAQALKRIEKRIIMATVGFIVSVSLAGGLEMTLGMFNFSLVDWLFGQLALIHGASLLTLAALNFTLGAAFMPIAFKMGMWCLTGCKEDKVALEDSLLARDNGYTDIALLNGTHTGSNQTVVPINNSDVSGKSNDQIASFRILSDPSPTS